MGLVSGASARTGEELASSLKSDWKGSRRGMGSQARIVVPGGAAEAEAATLIVQVK